MADAGPTPPDGPTPPRWTRALLGVVLPEEDRSAILGDLEEGLAHRARSTGPRAARRWYRREAVLYALRLAPARGRALLTSAAGIDMTRDLRFAFRRLLRQPGFSLVVVATLALGVGGTATVFGVVDGVLLRPLPVHEPDRLVAIYGTSARDAQAGGMFRGFLPFSYPNFEDVRDAARTVDGIFVHSMWPVSVGAPGETAERVDGLYVSASYFDVLGVRPALGRTFRPDEDLHPGADAVVVLQHGYWQRRFAGDPDVVGRTLTLNGRTMEIVGVAPPGFRGTSAMLEPSLFVPVSMIGDVPPWGSLWERRGLRFFNVGARIAPGRTLAEVRSEMEALGTRLAEAWPEENRGRGIQVIPGAEARVDPNDGQVLSRTGLVLLVMSGLVLLIACMNVANLLLARALSREVEMAVRASLGASRGRLARQLAVESGLLFVLGAVVGIGGAVVGLDLLDGVRPPAFFGGSLDVSLDLRVLAATLGLTALCAALFGVGPAVRAAGRPAAQRLRARGSGPSGSGRLLRDGLVLGQVALSVVALAAAGTFVRSLRAARAIDPGFAVEGLGMMDVDLAAQGYEGEEAVLFYERMVETAGAVPGVLSAAVGGERPLGPGPLRRATRIDQDRSDPGVGHYVRVEPVTPAFFETLGIPVREGRALDGRDRPGSALTAMVNRRLAEMLWSGEPAVGQRMVISLVDDPLEVVGVAATAKAVSLDEDPQPILYLPLKQHGAPTATLFVRTTGPGVLEDVRRAVQALDPSMPVFAVATAKEVLARDLWTARATAGVLGMFGLIGLFLAAVGIYGVVAHSVRERTREMGLRLALGSTRGRVVGAVVGRVLGVAGTGALLGTLAAAVGLGAVSGLVVGVAPRDPVALTAVPFGLLAVTALAAWLPARRATRVDPMVVLRDE